MSRLFLGRPGPRSTVQRAVQVAQCARSPRWSADPWKQTQRPPFQATAASTLRVGLRLGYGTDTVPLGNFHP